MTRNGRMMLVGVAKEHSQSKLYPHVIYSDDHGKTWKMSPFRSVDREDESKLVELNNGSIIMDIRTNGKRRFTISNDNGISWGPPIRNPSSLIQHAMGKLCVILRH